MEFIGQNTIITELKYLLADIERGNNFNILLRAPSGFGKTTLGLICLNRLGLSNSYYYVPNEEGNINMEVIKNRRFHFIDEVHTLKTPEPLYQYLDSGEYTFFLASNESGSLKEPLINRCIPFIFEGYTDDELYYITQRYLNNPLLPNSFILEISRRCKRNPRIIKITCTRINYIIKNYRINSDKDYITILDNVLQIKNGGLNRHDEIYLDFLKRIGGHASLNVISSGTGLDKNLILSEVEPGLIYLGLIKITSKGRELCLE
jgi:Holliday junction resolvasome RuvABC ATP-dependent DNA helicase subunit